MSYYFILHCILFHFILLFIIFYNTIFYCFLWFLCLCTLFIAALFYFMLYCVMLYLYLLCQKKIHRVNMRWNCQHLSMWVFLSSLFRRLCGRCNYEHHGKWSLAPLSRSFGWLIAQRTSWRIKAFGWMSSSCMRTTLASRSCSMDANGWVHFFGDIERYSRPDWRLTIWTSPFLRVWLECW